MLCEKCISMFQSPAWGDHHPDLASFTDAAASGCYICNPLLQYALKESGAFENCIVEPYTYRIYRSGRPTFHIDMPMLKDGNKTNDCRTFLAIPSSEVTADFSIRTRTSAIPLSGASRTAQKWMSECLNGHEQCQKHTQPRSYPTRLLELGESTLRIVLPAKEKLSGSYAALSYCWGLDPTFLRLTSSNLEKFRRAVPYSGLPIAFQEAINFVKSLSIRYLWIDALCIIQSGPESASDWYSQCGKMHDVYSNCIVCLSLSRAANPNESCLGGRTANATTPFEVETTGIIANDESANRPCTIISYDYYREALYDQPLGFRAWGLQERLLAPRVLSFGLGELFWDCLQVPNASESFPYGLTNFADMLRPAAIPNTSDSEILRPIWEMILEEFTDRELTNPKTDKLVALSAVAMRIGSAMDDVYIAGHFWKTLPLSLNWQVQPPLAYFKRREKIPRRIPRSAEGDGSERQGSTPSWSWASMDGPLFARCSQYRHRRLADAESYTLALVDETNPAGQIVSASLKIRAYCAEIEWIQGEPIVLGGPRTWSDDTYWFTVNIDDPDDRPVDGTRCLIATLAEDDWLGEWQGLVLKEVGVDGERLYERIGHYLLSDSKIRERRPSWKDDFKLMFGQEMRRISLV